VSTACRLKGSKQPIARVCQRLALSGPAAAAPPRLAVYFAASFDCIAHMMAYSTVPQRNGK